MIRYKLESLERSKSYIKNGGHLEKVGNRIVAIASINTCKH